MAVSLPRLPVPAVALLLLVLALLRALPSNAFTPAAVNRAIQPRGPIHVATQERRHSNDVVALWQKDSSADVDMDKVQGIGAGTVIFGVVLLLNIWSFSIPVEFRRAKFCSAEQVAEKVDVHCMTTDQWFGGIANYYENGGGVHFDFSVEGRE